MSDEDTEYYNTPFWMKLRREAEKFFFRWVIIAIITVIAFLFTPVWEKMILIYETPNRLELIEFQLETLINSVRSLSGEDRVVNVNRFQSYVNEPVYLGDSAHLNLVVSRTNSGAHCILISRTPIFVDHRGAIFTGERVVPGTQVSIAEQRFILDIPIPSAIQTGRVTVSISLEYSCNDRTVFEIVDPFAFQLLPTPR